MSTKLPYQSSEIEFIERKSRFIGNVFTVYSEAEAREMIAMVREMHDGANHVVYAYDISSENATRFSDDGEPKGTAGMPVYEIFRREGLTCYCCTVTRYFGGILLGAGGLIRAYANTAKLALEAAGIAELMPYVAVRIVCAYPYYDIIRAFLRDREHTVENTTFLQDISQDILLPEGLYEDVRSGIMNLTSGQALVERVETRMRPQRIEKD